MCTRSFYLILLFSLILPIVARGQQATRERINSYTEAWAAEKFSHRYLQPIAADSSLSSLPLSNQQPTSFPAEQPVANEEGPESEVTAVMHPADTNVLVAAVMKTTANTTVDETEIVIYNSLDFGVTWTAATFNPMDADIGGETRTGGGDPVLTYGPAGLLHLTWIIRSLRVSLFPPAIEDRTRILHAVSQDNGTTWTMDEEPVINGTRSVSFSPEGELTDKEWIISDNNPASPHYGKLYLFYTNIESPGETGADYEIRTKTWTATEGWSDLGVAIPFEKLEFCHFSSPTITENGELYLMVAGATRVDEYTAFYWVKTENGGDTYTDPAIISYWDLPCFLQPPFPTPSPCVEGIDAMRTFPSGYLYYNALCQEFYAIWYADGFKEPLTEGTDIYFTRSKDQGLNWSEPIVVNQDDDEATDNFMPTGVVTPAGDFYVTWYDKRADENGADYYGSRYDRETGTFEEEFVISCARTDFAKVGLGNANFGVGEYNTTLATRNTLLPIWADGRSNDGDLDVLIAHIPITEESGNSCTPVSINSLANSSISLSVSPNPVAERLLLSITVDKALPAPEATIINASGQLVQRLPLPGLIPGEQAFEFSVVGFPAGIYFISVQSSTGGVTSLRFVHQ